MLEGSTFFNEKPAISPVFLCSAAKPFFLVLAILDGKKRPEKSYKLLILNT